MGNTPWHRQPTPQTQGFMEGFALSKISFLPLQSHHQWRPHSPLNYPKTLTPNPTHPKNPNFCRFNPQSPMLKALSSSCLRGRFQSAPSALPSHLRRHGTPSSAPFGGVSGSLRGRKNPSLCQRLFFCSDSTDGSDPAGAEVKRVEVEGEEAAADSKPSSAIVPTVFRPEDCLTVRFVHFEFIVLP